ncbi:MAG TPA: glycerol-3-phosphate 1-O-acyltransferase PlsY [Gammaproteobacteria bacterium]|nr:glycerol-3-phosphate 1-O-acyltransferase PlsY [Gammaproteobacteria bacterium]
MISTTFAYLSGALLLGYLFGSISTAIITCRLMGLPDPRTHGSGSPGATNVLRTGSKTAAIITLLGDAAKGLLPVLLAKLYLQQAGAGPAWLPAAAGIGAFLGHLYPLYFGFKGGKGVATAYGVLLGIAWPIFVFTGATWLLMAFIFRISSLSALTAFALAPFYTWWWLGSISIFGWILFMSVLIWWRHRANIQRLLNGTEPRIGKK